MRATTSSAWLNELLGQKQPPCVSIYMPFARNKPISEQNRIILKDLLDRADSQVRSRYGTRVADEMSEKLSNATGGETLREGDHEGLALFASPDDLKLIELQHTVQPMVEVGDSFHIRQLVKVMQQGARFAVLCVSTHNVRLFEGNHYQLREIPLPGVPRNTSETLKGMKGDYPNEPYGQQTMKSHQPPTDKDILREENFFRAVDSTVWEHYAREAKVPIVVCADNKHLAGFLQATKNDYILKTGINHSPDHFSLDRMHEEAWKLIEPRYREELERLADQFRIAQSQQLGSDQLKQVAEAAAVGRVGTLLIDEQASVPGILDRTSGSIASPQGQDATRSEDVLDDLAEMVLQMDGQVYVIPHDQMPTDAGVAAMFRY
ncbi:MAG TPA: hypothetical protein VF669_09465 [Tepidisphaeraceae bacterium]|jgi:hypothetical protein